MSAPTFPPEHFGGWTLSEVWPGVGEWWRLSGPGCEIDAMTAKSVIDLGADEECSIPIAAIERLLELRRAAVAAASAPPSPTKIKSRVLEEHESAVRPLDIVDDLKAPEPGSFEGAEIEREINALADGLTQEIRNAAVREALAELRSEMVGIRENYTDADFGAGESIAALDRLAGRFQ